MSKKKTFLWITGGIILLLIAVFIIVSMRVYVARSFHGRLRESRDFMGRQESPSMLKEIRGGGLTYTAENIVNIPTVRKLIKRAELNLEVKNCSETSDKIIDIVNSFSGIIIDSEIQKFQNEAKKGKTVLKVLPKDFDTVLAKLKELGKLDLERVTGEDVTEEYVDLEARLKNYQVVKERLLVILQDKARTVKDILEVERELARLGQQIETIQGRMKYLDRQVGLATITVNYYEPKAMAPEPLNIFKRFKETIRLAIEVFINVFNGTVVVIAALLPIVIWLAIIIAGIIIIRKLFKK